MSQEKMILEHLQSGQAITPMTALNLYGCFRLGARIFSLKKKGHRIMVEDVQNGKKRYAKYYIDKAIQMEMAI